MIKLTLVSLTIAIFAVTFSSCKKNPADIKENNQGQVAISISASQLKNTLELVSDSDVSTGITSVVVTIQDLDGKDIKSSEKIELYNMSGYYISKPISLVTGGYKLTQFLVLNGKNEVLYAAPLKASPKEYLVSNPLPISFTVEKDMVTKIIPEVLSTTGSKPEDFGYGTFSFEVAETFDFLVGVFVYNDSSKNFELTTANISIYSGVDSVYSGALKANLVGTIQLSNYDSLGITNKITLPERYNSYILEINKPGYKTYRETFTKEELRLYNRKEDKGPLVVILEKQAYDLTQGLVAYYPFDGNADDAFGTNHGIDYSNKVYSQGVNGLAHDFNGSTDYIKLTNTLEISKNLTFSFWVYSRGAVSTENNGTVIAKYNMAHPQKQCISLTTFGGKAYNTQLTNWIAVAFFKDGTQYDINDLVRSDFTSGMVSKPLLYSFPNPKNLTINNWEHAVVNVTPTEIQVYINGKLCVKKTREILTYFDDATEPTYIGNNLWGGEGSNNHYNGLLDNLRIYSRPLTYEEIQYIYSNKY